MAAIVALAPQLKPVPSLQMDQAADETDPFFQLRHGDDAQDILPRQAPSIHNQLIDLSFGPRESPIDIKLSVNAGPGCGGIAWPAGQVLSEYLARCRPAEVKGKTCLELGSGTGLVGIVAAKLGARSVFLTDQAPLLPIMQTNVALNQVQEVASVLELNWGEPLSQETAGGLDLVLAADCVYFEPAFPLLVKTLRDLQDANPDAEFLFCYKKRRKADKRFFSLLKKHFEWQEVEDDPNRAIYAKDSIVLLRLTRKKSDIKATITT